MNYAGVKYNDIANGMGCRTVLFVSGCRNHCKDCFQPETWDFGYGQPFDQAIQEELLQSLEPDYIQGLTILGGEPFEEENQQPVYEFITKVREQHPSKDIWMFTGYVYDRDLVPGGRKYTEWTDSILDSIDVMVDGPFIAEQKNVALSFRGSENQRVLDMKATRKTGEITWLEVKR